MRCDASRPKCSTCESLDIHCVYVQSTYSNYVTVGKDYLFTLEGRLSVLEHKLKSIEEFTGFDPGHHSSTLPAGEHYSQPLLERSNINHPSQDRDDVIDEDENALLRPGSMIQLMEWELWYSLKKKILGFWNWSSPGTEASLIFAGRMTRASRPPSPTVISSGRTPGRKVHSANVDFIPSEAEARRLIQLYFTNVGTLYPYIHEATFLGTYEEMKRNKFKKARRIWLGLFNMVLALATSVTYRSDVTADERNATAKDFYERAQTLCDEQILAGTSLEVVQYLLLVGQFLQGTQKSIQAWTIHGIAVKVAFQLGLHSSEAQKKFSPLDQEIRKRSWYGCIVLDRTLSMTFGRPAAIHEDYVRMPLPGLYPDASSLDADAYLNEKVSLEFFNAIITLYKIMLKTINLLYGGNIGSEEQPYFDNVAQLFVLEQQLVEWERRLPPNIKLKHSQDLFSQEDTPPLFEKLRIILTLRYHNTRILVHRFFLVRFLELSGKENKDMQQLSLLPQIGANSVQICVQSASEIIAIIKITVSSTGFQRHFLDAWWFLLYYTFNAVLVVFSGLLVARQVADVGTSLAATLDVSRRTLDDAVDALQLLDMGNYLVIGCGKYVEQLGRVVDSMVDSPWQPNLGAVTEANGLNNGVNEGMADQLEQFSIPPNQSNLGTNLGEFIFEEDVDFLNSIFLSYAGTNLNPSNSPHR